MVLCCVASPESTLTKKASRESAENIEIGARVVILTPMIEELELDGGGGGVVEHPAA